MTNKNNMLLGWGLIIIIFIAGVFFLTKSNNKANDIMQNEIGQNSGQAGQVDQNQGKPEQAGQTTDTAQVAKSGDTIAVNYTGRLVNGTVFDSNVDPKFGHVQPFIFNLGAGQVIPGWDKGIVGMKVGEKKTLTIAPEDAYGAAGAGKLIPPNATLVFDVELLGIKPK